MFLTNEPREGNRQGRAEAVNLSRLDGVEVAVIAADKTVARFFSGNVKLSIAVPTGTTFKVLTEALDSIVFAQSSDWGVIHPEALLEAIEEYK